MNKLSKGWTKAAEISAGAAFISLTALIAAEVIGRYFFGKSSPLRVELTTVCLIFLVYNLSGPIWHEDTHIRMDVLLLTFGPKVRTAVSMVSELLVVCCAGLWLYFALAMYAFDVKSQTVSDMAFAPLWWEQWVLPLGCLGMVYFAIVRVVRLIAELTGHKVEPIGGKPWSGY